MHHTRKSIGPCEPPINPPEGFDPPRCDPVDLDTVEDWRDKVEAIRKAARIPVNARNDATLQLISGLLKSMQDTIDDCHGLNDPEPERDEG